MPLRLSKRAGSPFWWITGTIGGLRIRESAGTDRRELAEEKRATREAELYRGQLHGPAPVRHSFAAVALSYLEHGGPHTLPTQARVDRLLVHFGPAALANEVDQSRIDRACAALLRPGAKPATRLREVIAPVRAVLIHGSKRRMCDVPVFDVGKASPGRTEWLPPAEVDALISAAAPHVRPLLAFLTATGARLGEALALDWRDVDLPHRRAVLRETKNGRDRTLDLCPRAVVTLEGIAGRAGRVFRTRPGEAYKVGEDKAEQGGGQIKKAWATARTAAGLYWKAISPHSLRHTWASWHYAMHRDLLLLRFEGDWSSVKLVERYAHLAPATMADEMRAWRNPDTRQLEAAE